MGFKPEDVRIPYDWYYYGPENGKEEPEKAPPAMYDQNFVNALKDEVEHYKRLYRRELYRNQQVRQR